jgi:hypothetical protein
MVEQTAVALAPSKVEAPKPMEEFITRWVNVEVIGFEEEDQK